jgi:hypothetical protein
LNKPIPLRSIGGQLEFVARILGGSLKLSSSGLAISMTDLIVQNISTSLRVCSSTICTKFNVQIGAGRCLKGFVWSPLWLYASSVLKQNKTDII